MSRSTSANPDLVALSNRIVYVGSPQAALTAQVIDWRNQNVEAVLVVDNCDRALHDSLAQEVKHAASRLSLLTLDFVPSERERSDAILLLEQAGNEIIRGILKQKYRTLEQSALDRIVEFAQGFPQMAVLLAEAWLQELPEIGSLNNDELVHRLVWGHDQRNEQGLKVISSCALFEVLGVAGRGLPQLEFVAKSICRMDKQRFYEWIVQFRNRGILEQRGDFIRVRT